jgi:iron complex transport system substrate-binding protein
MVPMAMAGVHVESEGGPPALMRIVSLLPSATEIVYALGLDDRLHGVTDECDWPPAARNKRIVVRSRQPAGMTPSQIDEWVGTEAPNGGLYRLDDAAIAEIEPDVLLTQDLCRVCAVPTGAVDEALARIGCKAAVVTLEPQRLDEVIASVCAVAEAAGEPDRGRGLSAALNERLVAVRKVIARRAPVRTLVLEWLDPPYTAGHWVPDVVVAAGGEPLLGDPGGRSRASTWQDALNTDPEVIVLAPCGVSSPDAIRQANDLVPAELLRRRVVAVDLARPGPRLVDCVEGLAAVLHPDAGLPLRRDVVLTPDDVVLAH